MDWPPAGQGVQAARVDADLANNVEANFEGPVRDINFERRDEIDETTWQHLIAESSVIINRIEQHRLAYICASSLDDYDWGLKSAEILRDLFLAMAQTGDLDLNEGFRTFWNIRDVSMTHSLEWILEREGPSARVLIGAHNAHLQQSPVRVQKATSMGSYIANRIGREKLLIIGAESTYSVKGDEPVPDSNPATYDQVGPECYFLDFRNAPVSGPVAEWLKSERMTRHLLRFGPLAPGLAWDCLLFHRSVSIADVAQVPSMMTPLSKPDPSRFDDYVGRYVMSGFLSQHPTLDIIRESDKLYSSGEQDTSGELFPPYRTEIRESEDGIFIWSEWPATLEFHSGDGLSEGVTINMPGMGVYHGKRLEFQD